jgi:hypothetical protein
VATISYTAIHPARIAMAAASSAVKPDEFQQRDVSGLVEVLVYLLGQRYLFHYVMSCMGLLSYNDMPLADEAYGRGRARVLEAPTDELIEGLARLCLLAASHHAMRGVKLHPLR